MRGKVNVDYEKSMKEFKELKKFRNLNPKEFNLDPKNKMKLDKLGKQIHNYERSAAMARELEKIGLSDTLENNNKIYENLFGVSKNVTSGDTWYSSTLNGPNGNVKIKSVWKILDGNEPYLSSVMIIPID